MTREYTLSDLTRAQYRLFSQPRDLDARDIEVLRASDLELAARAERARTAVAPLPAEYWSNGIGFSAEEKFKTAPAELSDIEIQHLGWDDPLRAAEAAEKRHAAIQARAAAALAPPRPSAPAVPKLGPKRADESFDEWIKRHANVPATFGFLGLVFNVLCDSMRALKQEVLELQRERAPTGCGMVGGVDAVEIQVQRDGTLRTDAYPAPLVQKTLDDVGRFNALEQELRELKGELAQREFKGPWMPDTPYAKGNSVMRDGSCWYSIVNDNRSEPGQHPDWRLMVMRGRRGRNA